MLLPRLEAIGMTQFFICSRNYDECIYRKMVDEVKQMNLTKSFSSLRVIKKVLYNVQSRICNLLIG